eukprot:5431048-Prymnesium_polylepis.1
MLFFNLTESRFRCAEKYLLWFDFALRHFPSAQWIASGDEDTYIQVAHLADDLGATSSEGLALYGLVMWLAFFNQASFDTLDGHMGWSSSDERAVSRRRAMQRCAESLAELSDRQVTPACARLGKAELAAVRAGALKWGPPAPYPMVSGPLFAVSRGLAALLSRESEYPRAWLADLMATKRVRDAQAHGPRRSVFACWPAGDAALGLWVAASAARAGQRVRLVHTPMMRQHHPWPSFAKGGFTNSSIVLHGLKQRKVVASQIALAERLGAGPFEPLDRACASCEAMGFSSWPGSVVNNWTCCSTPRQRRGRNRTRSSRTPHPAVRMAPSESDEPLWRAFVERAVARDG